MRLAVLAADPDGPVVRHRVRALQPQLRSAGFDDVEIHAIPKRLAARFSLFRSLADADVVLLMRKLFTVAELAMLRASAKRLIYDVDDAVMYRDPSRGRAKSHVRARRFRASVRRADRVTAGNAYLVAHAKGAVSTADVLLAPTPVDTERYVPSERKSPTEWNSTGARIGWLGSRSTRAYLDAIRPSLAAVLSEHTGAAVCVMADRAPDLGVPVEFTPWSEAAEVPFLQSLDVGLMPLSDDEWSRGKCGFKLLQYMACGVPSIASPVGVNVDIADSGTAALLAGGTEEWTNALRRLLGDRALAAELGERGRARVVSEWSAHELGPRFASALRPV